MSRDALLARRAALRSEVAPAGRVTLVTGAPCSGKSTYVAAHHGPNDVVIDYDDLAVALGSPDRYDHPEALRPVVLAAWSAALLEARRSGLHVWLIRGFPTARDLAEASDVVRIDATPETCKARAAAERPGRWVELIDRWFSTY